MLADINSGGRQSMKTNLAVIPSSFNFVSPTRFYTVRGNNNSVIYLTPCIPLSFEGEGEEKERGADVPLKYPALLMAV